MAEDKNARIAREIYENVGGVSNVAKIIHCMTRVRMTIKDYSQVDLDKLKAVDGVMGVVEDDTLQVIVGPGTVNKVAGKMVETAGVKLGEEFPGGNAPAGNLDDLAANTKSEMKNKYNKPSRIKTILKMIANIFVPLIPAFVGAGIVGGVAAVLSNMIVAGDLSSSFQQYVDVMNIIKNGIFSYLVIYVGINAAQEFGATPSLGGVIGAVTLLNGMNVEAPLTNIFTGQPLASGQGGIIGVIFAVWLLSLFEKQLRKVIPDSIDIIVTPTISLIVVGLATIFLIMPVAGAISLALVGGINGLLHIGGAIAGFVLGAAFLPMVMLGLHQVLTPIHIEMIEKTGSTQLLPILAMAGGGQVGAALALALRLRKNKAFLELVKGALPVGILGIGEPLIYGVTLPLGRPFITACIGGGVGGAVIGAMGYAGATAIGPSGLALIPLIVQGRWYVYIIGLLAAYAAGFLITYFFGIPASEKEKADHYQGDDVATVDNQIMGLSATETETKIMAPMTGDLVKLETVPDEVFSAGMLGAGVAIVPTDGTVVSPVSGTVTSVFPTKHAIGLTSDSGVEVLLHVGLDTVKLDGQGFESFVVANQRVQVGEKLLTVDLDVLQKHGLNPVTMMVITNSADLDDVSVVADPGDIQTGVAVLDVKK